MNEQQLFSISMIIFVILAMAVIAYYLRLKHLEKIELIKKGDYAFESNFLENHRYSVLSKGILLLSLALGFGIGYAITRQIDDASQIVIYLIALLGTSGMGMLGYYFIIRKLQQDA